MTEEFAPLKIKGARGKIEIKGARSLFFTILMDGEPVKRKRGVWRIPLRNGGQTEVRARGLIPGFQTLRADGEVLHDFGEGVPAGLRALCFLPLVIILVQPMVGMILAVLMFFLNVLGVRNTQVPLGLRWVLPVTNTFAGAIIAWMVPTLFQSSMA